MVNVVTVSINYDFDVTLALNRLTVRLGLFQGSAGLPVKTLLYSPQLRAYFSHATTFASRVSQIETFFANFLLVFFNDSFCVGYLRSISNFAVFYFFGFSCSFSLRTLSILGQTKWYVSEIKLSSEWNYNQNRKTSKLQS